MTIATILRTGIDLSNHNGDIDFKKVKDSGVDFAILRTGYGKKYPDQYDTKFEDYYSQCKKYGIPVGAYHFSYALTEEAAVQEAEFMLEIVKGKQFEYPLYFDIETVPHTTLSKSICEEIITAFCGRLEKEGYFAGIYSFDTFFYSNIPEATTKRFASWVARVEDVKPTYAKNYGIWQYSWKGKIDGAKGSVDMNKCYIDYPSIIKKAQLNGYGDKFKFYEITATFCKANQEQTDKITNECLKLGMTVTKKQI